MNEIWKDIQGFEGLYQVSNLGRVRSLDHYVNTKSRGTGTTSKRLVNGVVLTPAISHNGYYMVRLKGRMFRINRLVASTFIENRDNKPIVDHINGIRTDNRVCNLRWVTQKENLNSPIAKQHCEESSNKKTIVQLDTNNVIINIFNSITEASKLLNISRTGIMNCLSGRSSYCGGYRWSYL